jgi:hypothetical protein
MRSWQISQAMFTIVATTRCATSPGLSRITETGTPSEPRSPWAASRVAGLVAGVVITTRRAVGSKSASSATVRAPSSFSRATSVVASSPSGVTRHRLAAPGSRPSSSRAPSFFRRATAVRRSSGRAALTQTDAGRAAGTGGSGERTAAPSA